MTLILAVGGEHEMYDNTYSIYDSFEQSTRNNIYIWISEPTNGEKYLVKGNNIIYL